MNVDEALAKRALRWVNTIDRVNSKVSSMSPEESSRLTPALEDDFYLVAMSLGHVERYAKALSGRVPANLQRAIEQFVTEWEKPVPPTDFSDPKVEQATLTQPEVKSRCEKLSDLRDALEHEANYVAGKGKFPRLPASIWEKLQYSGDGYIWGTGGIHFYYVLGNAYPVRRVVKAAIGLRKPLIATLENGFLRGGK